ncbi:MAG: PH domain-containing protein [Synergistaceae bacterium]|nr:PH domain-containing protein [Synergistaceae bacterium]
MSEKREIMTFRPAWRSFYWHMAGIVLCFAAVAWGVLHYPQYWKGVTGFFFIVALGLAGHMSIRRFSVALLVKPEEVSLEQGFVGRHSVEISTPNIRTIQVNQNPIQRLLDVGNLLIGSAATKDYEICVSSLPKPYAVRDLIQTYERSTETREASAD